MRRKILMGVLALALPAGTMAFTQSASFAAKPPPNPVSCNFAATVTVWLVPWVVSATVKE